MSNCHIFEETFNKVTKEGKCKGGYSLHSGILLQSIDYINQCDD